MVRSLWKVGHFTSWTRVERFVFWRAWVVRSTASQTQRGKTPTHGSPTLKPLHPCLLYKFVLKISNLNSVVFVYSC